MVHVLQLIRSRLNNCVYAQQYQQQQQKMKKKKNLCDDVSLVYCMLSKYAKCNVIRSDLILYEKKRRKISLFCRLFFIFSRYSASVCPI